jgi:hypothetical protein
MPEGRNDTVGHDGAVILCHAVQDVVADRPLEVGGVEVDELMGARSGNERERVLG